MKTISLPNHTVLLYDSIRELPAERDSIMNFYMLEDMGIGTDMATINSHLNSIAGAAAKGDYEEVSQHIMNVNLGFQAIITGFRPDMLCWACLIHSINGEPLSDTGAENLRRIISELSADGLTIGMLEGVHEEIKKKLPESFSYSSPIGLETI